MVELEKQYCENILKGSFYILTFYFCYRGYHNGGIQVPEPLIFDTATLTTDSYFERLYRKRYCFHRWLYTDWRQTHCLHPASTKRVAEDVDPVAGTSIGQVAGVLTDAPRQDARHLPSAASMKPRPMTPRGAKVRRKAGDREHVLARRVCLDAAVCGWLWPEPEPLRRAAGLRWEHLVLWLHHRLPTAGLRRDHVSSGLGLLVAEDALPDRRGSAGRCCIFASRIAVHQVHRPGRLDHRQTSVLCVAPRLRVLFKHPCVPVCSLGVFSSGLWFYLMLSGWAGWVCVEQGSREWVDRDVTKPPSPPQHPHHKHNN